MNKTESFFLYGVLAMCGAIMLMFLISRTTIGTLKGDLEIAQIRLDGCRREVDIEHARGDTFRDMLGSTEYVLWEVHALGPGAEWPGTKQMEVLCERLGDHSVLKTGTELVGYSYWGDVLGNPKIGCRYAKRLAP